MEYKNIYNSINEEAEQLGSEAAENSGKLLPEGKKVGRLEDRLVNINIPSPLAGEGAGVNEPANFTPAGEGLLEGRRVGKQEDAKMHRCIEAKPFTDNSPHPNPPHQGREQKPFNKNDNRPTSLSFQKSPIAFFDSGVGGLTVFEKVKRLLPNENTLYFGDTKNMPYGEKTEKQLIEYADNIFKFFEEKGVKAVIMACNTTSAVTYEKLKDNYNFKIYPIIQSVCKELANLNGVKKLGVIATPATIKSHAYLKEISKYNSEIEVFELSAPNWVRIVEEHRIYQPQSINQVKEILDIMSEFAPDKIVLACTHYPYLIDILKKFISEDKFIDPASTFAQMIKTDLVKNNLLNDKFEYERFFVSSDPENFKEASKMFYKLKDLPKVIDFNMQNY